MTPPKQQTANTFDTIFDRTYKRQRFENR